MNYFKINTTVFTYSLIAMVLLFSFVYDAKAQALLQTGSQAENFTSSHLLQWTITG